MDGLDRMKRLVHLAPIPDEEGGTWIPRRSVAYDTLVMAVGSETNDYGIPGVAEHCSYLDDTDEAERFHNLFFHNFLQAQYQRDPLQPGQLDVAIIGAGATGVELAAELHYAVRRLVDYGLDQISPDRDVNLVLIEAAEEILPALPDRVAKETREELLRLGVEIHTGKAVENAGPEGVTLQGGHFIPARTKVWAAGIKAPRFLADLDGLEANKLHQLVVTPTLQTTRDESIFAFGDCACVPQAESTGCVPPRAQAARQQASLLARSLPRLLDGKPLPAYQYRDYGSLISLSRYAAVGSLMGRAIGRVTIEGRLARFVYRSLYRMHQLALHGLLRTAFIMFTDFLSRARRPRLKLH
jgi:NADH dehydrogenase